jgi:prepilin-type N-terminal cleavage/methylation domain-containing protein
MNIQQKNREKGFTIIEVVLVLAIAGLIFLMVFIALPALQRNQRDGQRKSDLGRVQTAVQNFQSNNRNRLPSDSDLTAAPDNAAGFIAKYLTVGGDTFSDPDGTDYTFRSTPVGGFDHVVHYTRNAVCDGESLKTGQGAQKIAFQYKLEGGGIACVSN